MAADSSATNQRRRRAAILVLAALICSVNAASAQTQEQQTASDQPTKMVLEMKTGETHLSSPATTHATRLTRWFELQTASISNRYQFIENARGVITANHEQYQVTFKGRLKFDEEGKYSLHAGVFSGRNFFSGWNNSGWGTGRAVSNLYLKQLYFSAKPVPGVELQYGGLYLLHGEATEITSSDYDGYITGQRLTLTRPDKLYFDEISYTAGHLGDFNTPNLNRRYHRLRQVNYHHFLVSKRIHERVRASADYASEAGVDVFRQAVKIKVPETKVVDTFLFENYERAGRGASHGFNVYGEKKLHERLRLGGGYAQIDRAGVNSDRFLPGKRLHLNGLVTITPEFSLTVGVTQAVGNLPGHLPRTRLDIGFNYNLLHSLKRAGLF
jgi:hypothetical protein